MAAMAKTQNKTYDLVYCSMFAVLIAVCSWISIPASVPFTLQTMGVFTTLGILGGRRGTMAVLVYMLLGMIGIPVFAGFRGGIGVLAGNTGGYLVGFLFSALVVWGMERLFGKSRRVLAISMVLGLLVCYAVGTAWFMLVYTRNTGSVGVGAVLGWCVVPFVIPDLIKIAVSLLLSKRLAGIVRK